MKLNAPKKVTWMVAVVIGVVGVLARVLPIVPLAGYSFWLVTLAFGLLALASAAEGL